MFGLLYTAAYLLVRQIQIDAPKIKHVAPAIRRAVAKLPESERQAKADELWHDKAFVENTLTESYREKNWLFASFFYLFWGGALIWFLYWLFTGLSKDLAQ
jgi:hypothetical protein